MLANRNRIKVSKVKRCVQIFILHLFYLSKHLGEAVFYLILGFKFWRMWLKQACFSGFHQSQNPTEFAESFLWQKQQIQFSFPLWQHSSQMRKIDFNLAITFHLSKQGKLEGKCNLLFSLNSALGCHGYRLRSNLHVRKFLHYLCL